MLGCILLVGRDYEMAAGNGKSVYRGGVQRAPALCNEFRRLNLIFWFPCYRSVPLPYNAVSIGTMLDVTHYMLQVGRGY